MFSIKQKQEIAAVVEKALMDMNHPEMPLKKPHFSLHVQGRTEMSWAYIAPNWTFDINHPPSVNPHNEITALSMEDAARD